MIGRLVVAVLVITALVGISAPFVPNARKSLAGTTNCSIRKVREILNAGYVSICDSAPEEHGSLSVDSIILGGRRLTVDPDGFLKIL